MAFCCGGMQPIIQNVNGHGTAFLSAGGTVVRKTLTPDESVVVDTGSVVGFSPSVNYDVECVGNCRTFCCGGEGCFHTTLTGPGDVYLQSMSIERLIRFLLSGPGGGSGDDKDQGKKNMGE